jgi:hypothetical protein
MREGSPIYRVPKKRARLYGDRFLGRLMDQAVQELTILERNGQTLLDALILGLG